jgi:hypothetical protein
MTSKASALKATLAAATLSGASVANAQVAVKELTTIDTTRPIAQGTCVADSAAGKAFDKIETLKRTRGQTTVIEADTVGAKSSVTGSPYAGIYFTSNLTVIEGKRSVLGEGYVISSNRPKGQVGTQYCISQSNDTTGLASAINGTRVPGTVNIGEMGQALSNAMNTANSKVGYIAITNQRILLAVNFNFQTKEGGYIRADGNGNNHLPLPLANVEYSLDLPLQIQMALGMRPAAPEIGQSDKPDRVNTK